MIFDVEVPNHLLDCTLNLVAMILNVYWESKILCPIEIFIGKELGRDKCYVFDRYTVIS